MAINIGVKEQEKPHQGNQQKQDPTVKVPEDWKMQCTGSGVCYSVLQSRCTVIMDCIFKTPLIQAL